MSQLVQPVGPLGTRAKDTYPPPPPPSPPPQKKPGLHPSHLHAWSLPKSIAL